MPRNHNLGTSTLRNRNRVTNKTRLKVYHGNIDADPLVLDEDEEKARIVSTAGVDAEDANEHHLQAVLSAASQRHQTIARSTRGTAEKQAPVAAAAYIPTPDSTGIVDNYEEYYQPGRWRDPVSYIKSSETVDEASSYALAGGFTYFMDERDKEWLDRNNEEARGEGTSAQGAFSIPGTTTRSGSSQRSAKSKGKEPDMTQPVVISEDEFELVMGIFEKVTHDKTEFLHHGLEQGAFPPFSDYQDTYSSPLPLPMFTAFVVPPWVPPSAQLLHLARVIYPYWKERRIERGGHPIIPTLNYDESDVTNESYICFRRREIKAVRKTRASQATSSDKLIRLQSELGASLEIARSVLNREHVKKDVNQQTTQVWDKRMEFVIMKRKFPSLGVKEDEELLQDKERVPKKTKVEPTNRVGGLKLRTRDGGDLHSSAMQTETAIRPKERYNMITNTVDREMAKQKDRDHQWEDLLTNPYQSSPVHYTQRHWKPFLPSRTESPSSLGEDDDDEDKHVRFLRLRLARAQRLCLDRHDTLVSMPTIQSGASDLLRDRKAQFMQRMRQFENDDGDKEQSSKIRERWRFDDDDGPVIGPYGSDEHDRVLIDDYEPKYLRHSMTLLQDQDQASLMNDPTFVLATSDGRHQPIVPFRIGMPPSLVRPGVPRQLMGQAVQGARPTGGVPLTSPLSNGVPISMQVKSMQPPSMPHLRISSGGGMRLPAASPTSANMSSHSSPTQQSSVPASSSVNGVNHHPQVPAEGELVKLIAGNGVANGATHNDANDANAEAGKVAQSPTSRPKPDPSAVIPNGYHAQVNGYTNSVVNGGTPYMHNAGRPVLTAQQKQNLKAAFAAGQDPNAIGRSVPGTYTGHIVPSSQHFNVQLKPAPTRQWGSPSQQPTSLGIDTSTAGMSSPSPHPMALPVQTPSANGSRRGASIGMLPSSVGHIIGGGGQLTTHSASPHSQQQSPHPSTPTMKMASPALSHQQPVGNAQGGH